MGITNGIKSNSNNLKANEQKKKRQKDTIPHYEKKANKKIERENPSMATRYELSSLQCY